MVCGVGFGGEDSGFSGFRVLHQVFRSTCIAIYIYVHMYGYIYIYIYIYT